MFKRFETAQRAIRVVENPAYVVRDNRTKIVIASGDYAKCKRYMDAFGLCYIEAAA